MSIPAVVLQYALPAILGLMSATKGGRSFLGGKQEQQQQIPSLNQEQLGSLTQLMGGQGTTQENPIFQKLTDFLSQVLGGKDAGADDLEQQALRQFREQLIPQIAERFTGLGAGSQSSSAFQQAMGGGAAGIAENIAAMKSGRQMQAAGLAGPLSQVNFQEQLSLLGVRPFENLFRPETGGLLGAMAPGIGQAIGSYGLKKIMG